MYHASMCNIGVQFMRHWEDLTAGHVGVITVAVIIYWVWISCCFYWSSLCKPSITSKCIDKVLDANQTVIRDWLDQWHRAVSSYTHFVFWPPAQVVGFYV